MDYTEIRYEKHGEVCVIAFDRPEVLNCVGPVTHRELIHAWSTFRVIDAQEALRIGLANEIVKKGASFARALQLAEFICTLPQSAMRTDKEAAIRGFGLPLDEGLRIEAECFNRSIQDPATIEGLRQFIERDHPDRQPDKNAKTPGLTRG